MCKTKNEYANKSFMEFDEKDMKIFYDEIAYTTPKEDWHQKIIKAKQKLKKLDDDALAKEKLDTQINLANATMQNRNSALEFGVPVASLVFSVISILFSIRLAEPTSYNILDQKIEPILSKGFSYIILAAMFLCVCTIATLLILIICQFFCKKRKYEVFYYQTILNIIESIEKEREHSNHYDVSVHNTETGETKQYNAYLLPKKDKHTRKDTNHEKDSQPHSLSLHAVGGDADIRVRIRKRRHRK